MATADNSGHTASVLRTLAQIRQSRTSYVRRMLYDIPPRSLNKKVVIHMKSNKRNIVIIFGLPYPAYGRGSYPYDSGRENRQKIRKRLGLYLYMEPGTEPKEDMLTYEWLFATLKLGIEAGFNLLITRVFAYDRYYRLLNLLQPYNIYLKSYRISGKIPTEVPKEKRDELITIKKFHKRVLRDFNIFNIELGELSQKNINNQYLYSYLYFKTFHAIFLQ